MTGLVARAWPARGRSALAVVFGALAFGGGVGLIAASVWLAGRTVRVGVLGVAV